MAESRRHTTLLTQPVATRRTRRWPGQLHGMIPPMRRILVLVLLALALLTGLSACVDAGRESANPYASPDHGIGYHYH